MRVFDSGESYLVIFLIPIYLFLLSKWPLNNLNRRHVQVPDLVFGQAEHVYRVVMGHLPGSGICHHLPHEQPVLAVPFIKTLVLEIEVLQYPVRRKLNARLLVCNRPLQPHRAFPAKLLHQLTNIRCIVGFERIGNPVIGIQPLKAGFKILVILLKLFTPCKSVKSLT